MNQFRHTCFRITSPRPRLRRMVGRPMVQVVVVVHNTAMGVRQIKAFVALPAHWTQVHLVDVEALERSQALETMQNGHDEFTREEG